ncbi:MAG: hypothetical protein ACYDBB_19155 [Armatimonadota bacterium]
MSTLPLRIFRSYQAKYYEDDILHGPAAYPEAYFAELAENGFNAVWLRGILRDLTPTGVFPGLGSDIPAHQDALGTVVERAKRHGVRVLLYLNEPMCLPRAHPFWQQHPEVRGASGDSGMDEWPETYAFCTSTPEARAWLREVMANLFRDIPDLGGWFLISASEHHTHCYSHVWNVPGGDQPDCPRCAERKAVDVVAELITDLCDGTRASSATAETIAWNWGWTQYEPDPQPSLLAQLPKDVAVLLDWERGGHRTMPDGKPNFVDEYSLLYVGPSERFLATCREAQQQGLPVMTKLQVGTTHELATVPNLPLVDHLYAKLKTAEELGLHGMLATWNFGNMFSLNTAVVGQFVNTTARPTPQQFVTGLAAKYFPGADAAGVADAIAQLSAAMDYFPFDVPLLYFGPLNYALAYPLTAEPLTGKSMGWSWMMHERGDDLSGSLGQFTLDEIISYLDQLVRHWEDGVTALTAALQGCVHPHAAQELNVAQVIGHCYRSACNVYRTYRLRRDRPASLADDFHAIVLDEIANLQAALPLVEADVRLGFHAECQGYQFTADMVRQKLLQLSEQELVRSGSK